MEHIHQFDENGKQLCCTLEHKINRTADEHEHDHGDEERPSSNVRLFAPAIISLIMLLLALIVDTWHPLPFFNGVTRLVWYLLAYLPVGYPVVKEAIAALKNGEVFTEFFLMSLATLGAFYIGQYPEGVAVMLFYAVGEVFQTLAVRRAKSNIKKLLDQRPDTVNVIQGGKIINKPAKAAIIGESLQLRPGEKLGLDGILVSDKATFNTAALTGESKPDTKERGEKVYAGMINMNSVAIVQVTTEYQDSKLSRIIELVQNASAQKAPTELFIRRFARIYTPIVVFLAVAICFIPYFFDAAYDFDRWLYRALIFLVISCPCALVISIPLGYFGGIGAASRNGILIKGGQFLDLMAAVTDVVMDKTGTLTLGVFRVQDLYFQPGIDQEQTLKWLNLLESQSTHPIASAIREYVGEVDTAMDMQDIEEIAGHGLSARIEGKSFLAGNFKLMDKYGIAYDADTSKLPYTVVAMAIDRRYAGYITIADETKEEAQSAVNSLKQMGIEITMLSGDKQVVVDEVAQQLGIRNAYGDLLPEDKVAQVKRIKTSSNTVAFVGDGVNDAPVVALSDAGIAMGGLGSDATIETADIVIQDDHVLKIPMTIRIGKATKRIVWQNISLAFGVKLIVLILGAGGLATMWEAVFADVGVSLLAILNAIRIQKMKFT